MNITKKTATACKRGYSFTLLMFSIFVFFRNEVKLNIIKISILSFIGKFLNMITMFIPIKVFFVLSGTPNIDFLANIEEKTGTKGYIAILVSLVAIIFIINTFIQLYKGKATNQQKDLITEKHYILKDRKISRKIVLKTHIPLIQITSDIILIAFSLFILLIISPLFSAYFISTLFLYIVFIEHIIFSPYETLLLRKTKIDKKQLINICNNLYYLVLFIGIVLVFILNSIHVLLAILMLLISRLANTAIKSIFTSQITLRRYYFESINQA